MFKDKKIRLNSEKKIEDSRFALKIGTINKVNPEAIYYEGRAFISPMIEKASYGLEIDEIRRNFKDNIKECLKNNKNFGEKYILDFKIAQNGICFNKKSFLSFQLTLKQNENIKKLKDIKEEASVFINRLVSSLANDIKTHYFTLSKSKK